MFRNFVWHFDSLDYSHFSKRCPVTYAQKNDLFVFLEISLINLYCNQWYLQLNWI